MENVHASGNDVRWIFFYEKINHLHRNVDRPSIEAVEAEVDTEDEKDYENNFLSNEFIGNSKQCKTQVSQTKMKIQSDVPFLFFLKLYKGAI